MNDSQDIIGEELENFGLTKYEIKIYIKLLHSGNKTAKELSRSTSIAMGRIYDVLNTLESKGLIERQESRPMKFLAATPSIAIKNLLEIKNNNILLLKKKAHLVEEKLNAINKFKSPESMFWNVSLGRQSEAYCISKMMETKKTIHSYMEFYNYQNLDLERMIKSNYELYLKLYNEGVDIRILIGVGDDASHTNMLKKILLKLLKNVNFEVKITNSITNGFDLIDGEKIVIRMNNPIKSDEIFASIFVWDKDFATELESIFNILWIAALKI